jgi:DNA-binding MarR family transcriptional regulator
VLGNKRANMVPLIAGLLAKGLLEKRRVDDRSHALSLTAAGLVQRDAAEAIIQAHDRRFEALFSSSKVAALRSALVRIAAVGEEAG